MSGEPTVDLIGAERLLVALRRLEGFDFALVGGLGVMARLGRVHRATEDLDGVFDNDTDKPTTALLVAAGIAEDDPAVQRVTVDGAVIDVIDTMPLPEETDLLPDDPGPRLFVGAHRFAYESALPIRLLSGNDHLEVRVATVPALIAMKAHALRFAHPRRRAGKRTSDLADLRRLAAVLAPAEIARALRTTSWALHQQVRRAIVDDVLLDPEAAVAALRRSNVPEIAATDPDDLVETVSELTDALVDEEV